VTTSTIGNHQDEMRATPQLANKEAILVSLTDVTDISDPGSHAQHTKIQVPILKELRFNPPQGIAAILVGVSRHNFESAAVTMGV